MKTRIILPLLLITVFFTSCKDEKSIDNLPTVTPEKVEDNSFKFTLKCIVKKNDDFALYFTEDGSISFEKVQPIWQGIKGSENEQEITYSLPEDAYPTQFRIDLGLKQDQQDIIIKGVKMTYKGKTFEANGPKFFEFFRADENQCTADVVTGTIKAVVKDGVRKMPSIYPHQAILGPELVKLIK